MEDQIVKMERGEIEKPFMTQELAQYAIRHVLGKENDYLQRLLTARLHGHKKTAKIIPLSKVIKPANRDEVKQMLDGEVHETQKAAVEVLFEKIVTDLEKKEGVVSREEETSPDTTNGIEKEKAISSWVLNTVLQEKLKDREVRENSDYWKYINGALAFLLPLATGLIQHYLTNKFCDIGSE